MNAEMLGVIKMKSNVRVLDHFTMLNQIHTDPHGEMSLYCNWPQRYALFTCSRSTRHWN